MKEKSNWVWLIEAYHTSALTQKEFCLQNGVDLGQFKWQLRLSRREGNRALGFVQVSVTVPEQSPLGMELHFPDGLFLRFAGEVGPDYLRQLIIGLRS